MHPLVWTVAAFLAGSLPFSVWIGRLRLGVDIRAYGDHNPGATNVLRAGGKGAAALALLLDMVKGALPLIAARSTSKISNAWLAPIALAPAFGHAFSPFLGGRGGKAV
ncbi:MAG TPA: glycerol-3-phosphate acyltransferase, partial [Caldilineaceae bacterium]|nr:glycerol-3-phosphate acyltransferase [Caldilineaceae bacterium]